MAFAVLRCQKVKANDVSKVHNHNLRKYENHSAERTLISTEIKIKLF